MNNTAVLTSESKRFIKFFLQELKPQGKWLTPFNVISIPIIIIGVVILYFRFTQGLGSVTNLSQQFPWGFWIGFDVVTGVAFAGGAYVIAFVEFSPVIAEWAHWEKVRRFVNILTLGAVIFGISLSMLHQSGLGALFLMAKPKIHPLWYSDFIPILFFVSSIFAGLSMIIFEGTISHKVFKNLIGEKSHYSYEEIILGLGKGAAITMFVYYFFQSLIFIHEERWTLINDFWGYWYLFEVIGFVLIPCFIFAYAVRNRSFGLIRIASVISLIGIILNRLNVSVIAFNWNAVNKYYPSWREVSVTLMVIFSEIWVFRWIVVRMPVFSKTK